MSAIDTLPGIDLARLTESAALMTRVDRKYLVPRDEIDELIGDLAVDLRVLEIGGRRRFAYRSTYYDTSDLAAYRAAATGRRRRWKVRRRDYVDTDASFLEVKTRTGRGESSKLRIALDDDGADTGEQAAPPLGGAPLDFVRTSLADADCVAPTAPLLPVLTTAYDRTTLLVAAEDSRLTLDDALVWSDPAGRARQLRDQVVVETKSGTRAGSVDRVLWRAGHRPQRLSKYATGLALLDADLPANRWHRTVRAVSRGT
ncbi:VTC domain-containing protein [Brachybacterium alimentarium]|uniref:VTC domain-containing protein n=1 Tax=Brachybacterium alimentarium TaxID=47845 RepID=UPI003FCF1D9F